MSRMYRLCLVKVKIALGVFLVELRAELATGLGFLVEFSLW